MALTAGTSLGRYAILERIGAGGMGEVYKARDTRLERDVALKVLPGHSADPSARRRLRQEALALSRLNHANIATLHDFDSHGEVDFLVMELIVGVPLHRRIPSMGMHAEEVAAIGVQVSRALDEAHRAGIVHRDLKPGNVMITARDQVKVLDFGLARLVRLEQGDEVTGIADSALDHAGTLPYMAPEQLRGDPVRPQTDIYAFGAMLFEMLTGQRPFRAPSAPALMYAILNTPAPGVRSLKPDLPAELAWIVAKCLEKRPEARYGSAAEAGADLERAQALGQSGGAGAVPASALATPPVDTIVALPTSVRATEADAFLADAIPAALSMHLAKVDGLDTRLPPTAAQAERVGGDVEKVAAAYGATTAIVSTIAVHRRQFVLGVQLIDVATRRVRWGQELTGSRSRYLDLVRRAADAIREHLRPEAAPAPVPSGLASSAEAELLLQRGLYHANLFAARGRPEDRDRALQSLEEALTLAPTRGDAAAHLAVLHFSRLAAGDPTTEVRPEVEKWTQLALRLDPRSSRAWAVLSDLEHGQSAESYRSKLEYALKAAAFGPRDAYAHNRLSGPLAMASYELALAAARHAQALDPLMPAAPFFEAATLLALDRREEALDRIDRALRIEPDVPFGMLMRAFALIANERDADAEASLAPLEAIVAERRLHPQWFAVARDLTAFLVADRAGQSASGEAAARLATMARGESPFPHWQGVTQLVAPTLARHGRHALALEVLEARRSRGTQDTLDYLLFDRDLRTLGPDPRFRALLDGPRARFDDACGLLEAAQARGELPLHLAPVLAELPVRIAAAFDAL